MKCAACNSTLTTDKWDPRRNTLEDMCHTCIMEGLEEHESDLLGLSRMILENQDVLTNKE